MKKIFLIISLFIGLSGFTQTTLQNAQINFDAKIVICYDTITNGEYLFKEVDSVSVGYKLNDFITMCKTLYGDAGITKIICQNTKEQAGDNYPRILIRKGAGKQIFYYSNLSALNKITYDSFINQCKTFIP